MKLKLLISSCLLLICSIAFAQTWENMGTPTLQRAPTVAGFQHRFNAGAKGNYYPFPNALQGQILKASADNTMVYGAQEPWEYGQFIYTDAQLARALNAGQATQLQIFNSFFRYSHGGSQSDPTGIEPNNLIPGQPTQTNSWAYDTLTNRINSTFNSGSAIGLVSSGKYDTYTHTATLGSSAADNDLIGLEIAYTEAGTVANNAYGLDTSDCRCDVTHTTVPNQHSLTVFRDRNGATNSYIVVYDWQKLTQKIISNGSALSGLYTTSASWVGVTVDMRVVRAADAITVYTSNFSDAPGGKGSLRFPLVIDLNSDTVLTKFKGQQSYGYVAQSQAGAFFSNIVFSGSSNNIYDLRTGGVWVYTDGAYVFDPTKSMYTILGTRFIWRNQTEQTFGYVLPSREYDVVVQPVIQGQVTLVAGTKTISIPGLTTTNKAFVSLAGQIGTVTTTWQYKASCVANNLIITALTTAGATNTGDVSVINYQVTE